MRIARIFATLFLLLLLTSVASADTAEPTSPPKPVVSSSRPAFTIAATTPHLNYYGGPVIANVKVVPVLWGAGVNSTTQSKISQFFSDVTGSSWMDLLKEYSTAGVPPMEGGIGSDQTIGHGTSVAKITITPSDTATTIDDSAIQTELIAQIESGHLPANDANTAFMLYFAPGTTVTMSGSSSCSQFCGYHSTISASPSNIRYGVIPDLGSGGCQLGCGPGASTFDNVTTESSHQLAEIVTDPDVGLSSTYGPPLAWYDPQGSDGEIGDICNLQESTINPLGTAWTVQELWSNVEGACTFTAPTDYTTLSTPCLTTFVENQATTLTATVSQSNAVGTMTFQDGANVFCSNVAVSSGNASCQTPVLTVQGTGTSYVYLPTGSYSGNYTPSVSVPLPLTVLKATDVISRDGFEADQAGCPTH